MHEFFRAIGFSHIRTKKQENELSDWVLQAPDRFRVVSVDDNENLAMAEKEIPGRGGVAVVGELDEEGQLVPSYLFPYLSTTHISSDSAITFEHMTDREGFSGMCEDNRLPISLIFSVHNITDVIKKEQDEFPVRPFRRVAVSALLSDATILLPMQQTVRTKPSSGAFDWRIGEEKKEENPWASLNPEDPEEVARLLDFLRKTDVYTLVDSFFMPNGMASDHYYFLGNIIASARFENPVTKEEYYRMTIESNGFCFSAAVNCSDTMGEPKVGYRIKAHGIFMGELKN